MGKITKIGWTHHTFNIVWGCTKVSEGCWFCYADTWAQRCGLQLWGKDAERRIFGEKHWSEPLAWNRAAEAAGERRRVFCSSMADVFEVHPTVAAERKKLWPLIRATPWLDWLLLTKRPETVEGALIEDGVAEWPRNAWLGFTGENQRRFNERWPVVQFLGSRFSIPIIFCSAEPLLEELDVTRAIDPVAGRALDWIIVGGESGTKSARPFDLNWAGQIILDCHGHAAVFVKQMGSRPVLMGRPVAFRHPKGEDPSEWMCSYQVQEIPKP
jgi:protein gp37